VTSAENQEKSQQISNSKSTACSSGKAHMCLSLWGTWTRKESVYIIMIPSLQYILMMLISWTAETACWI